MARWCLALIVALFLGLSLALARPVAAQTNQVLVLEIKGPVTPAMVNYFERGINEAEAQEATAVLIVLDTPGGAVDATLEIVRLFRNAEVPIIVYVGPAGAQAASAGSIITMAAHAAGMAPETVIGAAAVIGGGGEELGETARLKATEDLQAVARSLTERRGEEVVALAEAMIDEARAVNSAEALEIGLIDAVAGGPERLLDDLDGLEVRVDGQPVALETAGAELAPLPMNAVEQALLMLSNPLVIGFLLAIAVPAILIELQSPGGWVAGFVGVLSLFLGLYGLGQLPANWLGLGLIVIAFVLLLLEVKTATGALGIAGGLTLLAGLLVLFNSPSSPEFVSISIPGALAITVVTAGFFLFISSLALRTRRLQPATGQEGLIGQIGVVSTPLTPAGLIRVRGEIWQAQANRDVPPGTRVVVKSMNGFTLSVEPVEPLPVASEDA